MLATRGTVPVSGKRPWAVLRPVRSFQAEGLRTEPPVSEPMDRGCQAERDRGGGARGRPAGDQVRVVDIGRRGRGRVGAEAREGQFGHVGLAEADRAAMGGRGEDGGVDLGDAAFEELGAGFGGHTGAIEEVFPGNGDAVQEAATGAGFGAGGGGLGLGPRTVGGSAGVDALGRGMGLDGREIGLRQVARVDLARPDSAAEVARAHPEPVLHGTLPSNGRRPHGRGVGAVGQWPAGRPICERWNMMRSSSAAG